VIRKIINKLFGKKEKKQREGRHIILDVRNAVHGTKIKPK